MTSTISAAKRLYNKAQGGVALFAALPWVKRQEQSTLKGLSFCIKYIQPFQG
jgi:hypothetical protein